MHYNAFGEETSKTPLSPWRFSSKRFDIESNLTYFGHRYYSASLGRWTTSDPSGYSDGPNLYAYVHNNPLTHFDLYGLTDLPVHDSHDNHTDKDHSHWIDDLKDLSEKAKDKAKDLAVTVKDTASDFLFSGIKEYQNLPKDGPCSVSLSSEYC